MLLVEGDVVHCPDITVAGGGVFNTMAFEAEVATVLGLWVCEVDVDDAATSFDGADGKALTISKGTYRASCILEWTLFNSDRVKLTIHYVLQVPDVHKLFRMSSDQNWECAT